MCRRCGIEDEIWETKSGKKMRICTKCRNYLPEGMTRTELLRYFGKAKENSEEPKTKLEQEIIAISKTHSIPIPF